MRFGKTHEPLPHAEIVRKQYPFFADDWGRDCALSFIATIDCAAANEAAGDPWAPLPTTGYLHVFWNRAGALGQARQNTAVIYCDVLGDPRAAHEDVVSFEESRFDTDLAYSVRRSAFWETFDNDEMWERGIQIGDVELEAQTDRILGWEWPIQNEAFLSAINEHLGRSDVPAVWPTFEAANTALYADWILLLQLDLYDRIGYLPGTLYVYVPIADVAVGRFDRVYGIYQQT